jgi:Transposase DDE domain
LRTNFKNYPMNVETLTEQILRKMSGIGKIQFNFLTNLVYQWLCLRGRYSFENLTRQGFLNAVSYRKHFGRAFNFSQFNHMLIKEYCSDERLAVFNPSFITKSGKFTEGLGRFWSGCAQSLKWGLEIAAIGIVDVKNHTAFHYHATQTILEEGQSHMSFYISLLQSYATDLRKLSKYIVVDAFFAKSEFIQAMLAADLEVITRLRNDAALWYLYKGLKRTGRGRPTKYAGKVKLKDPDKDHFTLIESTTSHKAYEAVVFSKTFKRSLKVVLIHNYKDEASIKNCKVFASTDTTLDGLKIWQYYKLRFQHEFLFRDGKQFTGLNHCQSRKKERLSFQFNFSLTILSIAKVAHWLNVPIDIRPAFSIQDIKSQYFNEHLLDKFIFGLGICPQTVKNSDNYRNLIKYTKIAA